MSKHRCSNGFLLWLFFSFYFGFGTEEYWGEAKRYPLLASVITRDHRVPFMPPAPPSAPPSMAPTETQHKIQQGEVKPENPPMQDQILDPE